MRTTTKRPDSAANATGAVPTTTLGEPVMDSTQPTPLALLLTADLTYLSWGELRAFVRMADLTGIPDDAPVELDLNDHDEIVGIAAHIDPRILNGGR